MVVDNRRSYLLRHIDVATAKGLEIGPYVNPTVRKDEGDIRYLDFYSTEELQAKEQDRRAKGVVIPHVDYVVKSDDYYRHVEDRFDYVIANHVIEHVDNPLEWVNDLAKLVHDDGVIFLTVPDKKYNFDRYRTDTSLSHLLADFFRGHGDHTEHGLDIQLNYDTQYIGEPVDLELKLNVDKLRESFEAPTHPGRHNHVFQSETFVSRILRPLQKTGIWPYTLLEFGEAPKNHGEFYLVLRKGQEDAKITLQDVYGPQAGSTIPVAHPPELMRESEPNAEETAALAAVDAEAKAREATMTAAELAIEAARLRSELTNARHENEALRKSLSWRLTKPVRKILDAFQ